MFERLEGRRLLSVSATFASGVLTVTGDSADNHVVKNSDTVIKTINYADLKQIKVSLLGGNDTLDIGPNITTPSTLSGGDGNDSIQGGAGNDTVTYAGAPGGVKVTLDNVNNDGGPGRAATATQPAVPPEGDNVKSD